MVRFKNRHLLVEFLQPSSLDTAFTSPHPVDRIEQANAAEETGDEEQVLQRIPEIPFLLPLPPNESSKAQFQLSDDGGSAIYRAIRAVVQEVYGDEGWGRIASSFKVIYHSPLTTLTIVRISRPHYRLVWSAITLLTTVNGQTVLPRVVAVSGTIKKLQNAAISYHRGVTARVLAVALDSKSLPSEREDESKRLERVWDREREQLEELQD